jgi:hypothetical protein
MRILLTNNTLAWRGGTEMYVLDVARRLQALGHLPVAYSSELGVAAEAIRVAGIPVVNDLTRLPFQPDVIHGQHHLDTMTALLCLPGVPAVYFCHGALPWQEKAPSFPRIHRYVAVDQACFERMLCEQGIPEDKIITLLNFVDLNRFQPRPPLPAKPQRALIYSVGNPDIEKIIRSACAAAGIELDILGNLATNTVGAPEKILPRYDLVFAKGRAALESMAVGCAVIPFTGRGCGPLVSLKNFDPLRRLNFGYRTGRSDVTVDFIASQIAQYDAADAAAVAARIRIEADMHHTVDRIVELYTDAIAEQRTNPSDPAAELRAAGIYFQSSLPSFKRAPQRGLSSKYRLFEKMARKADKLSAWLRS